MPNTLNSDDLYEIDTVYRKDLKEVLRDHRTLLISIVMPVLLYPLFLLLPPVLAEKMSTDSTNIKPRVVLTGDREAPKKLLANCARLKLLDTSIDEDPASVILTGKADLVIDLPPGLLDSTDLREPIKAEISTSLDSSSTPPEVTVYYDGGHPRAFFHLEQARASLEEIGKSLTEKILANFGITSPSQYKISIEKVKTESSNSYISDPLRSMLPFFLFSMICAAIIYPALDVITGERERNTLILLLTTPAHRQNIIRGKQLVVMTIGMGAMLLGICSLFLTSSLMTAMGLNSEAAPIQIPLPAALASILILSPLVVVISSLAILLAAFCRTFQQGQGYFVPFIFAIMACSSICSLPNLKLSSGIAFVPIVSIALALKEVMSGIWEPLWLCISVFSTGMLAWFVTKRASLLLDDERLLFSLQSSIARRRQSGDFGPELLIYLSTVFLLMFYIGAYLQAKDLVYGSILTQIFLILLPALILLRLCQQDLPAVCSIRPPGWRSLTASILLALPVIFLSMTIFSVQSTIIPAPELFTSMFQDMVIKSDKPIYLILIAMALAPAICEEFMFRGAILGLLRKKMSVHVCIIVVGLLFGLFHLSIFRALPTAVLGAVLTGLTIASGSIIPSIFLHLLNNSILILAAYFGLEERLSGMWLPALFCLPIALWLIFSEMKIGAEKS